MNVRREINRMGYILASVIILLVVTQCTSVKDKTAAATEHKKFGELIKSARKLTPSEARELDKSVNKEPDNLEAAVKWLIYNSNNWLKDAKIKKQREKIIFHLIEKHPESAIFSYHYANLYEYRNDVAPARKLWQMQIEKHPEDLKILSNAASNLLFFDKKLCEKYLKKGQELEPDNPLWSIRLGNLYKYESISDNNNKGYIKSYLEYERAYRQTAVDKRSSILITLAQVAYILEKDKEAENYARQMLERGKQASEKYEKGVCLYNANTLSGLLALRAGNNEEAGKYLIKSGNILVANKLPYFCIDMSLACMLTFKQQEKSVLEYLETIARYSPESKYKAYIKDIKAGIMPEYRRLAYYDFIPLLNKINTARRNKFLSIAKTLSAAQVAVLEKELAELPDKYTDKAYGTITKLVAYYYINKDKDIGISEKRRQLIYRIVQYFPRYSLLAYPETWLRSEKSDKKLIELCKANIGKFPAGDACPLRKAAYQAATHDNKLAEEALMKSYKVKPGDSEWKKALAGFYSRVNSNQSYMSYK
ncbi:MAG: hypothetical protein PHV59_10355 [Victivallales bacterium]|nr:hypothetical protein [Victivallales bacterium]